MIVANLLVGFFYAMLWISYAVMGAFVLSIVFVTIKDVIKSLTKE